MGKGWCRGSYFLLTHRFSQARKSRIERMEGEEAAEKTGEQGSLLDE